MCRAKVHRTFKTAKRVEEETDSDIVRQSKFRRVAEPEESTELAVIGQESLTESDKALMNVYLNRGDVSCSILDDLLPLTRMRPPPQFPSSQAFFSFVDSLPGPAFLSSPIKIPEIGSFDFMYRSVLEFVEATILQQNGSFWDPKERGLSENGGEFTDGSRFRELQQQLQDAVGDDAVLMPLIISSGMNFFYFSLCMGH